MNLYIDGKDLGPVIGPCRKIGGERGELVFLMKAGYYITVETSGLKSFDNCTGDFQISLYH